MTEKEIRYLLDTDPDFIGIKRFDFSLKKLLERYPDGCPDRIIAQALLLTEDEVKELHNRIVEKLKEKML